jgi:hypothetical protein
VADWEIGGVGEEERGRLGRFFFFPLLTIDIHPDLKVRGFPNLAI